MYQYISHIPHKVQLNHSEKITKEVQRNRMYSLQTLLILIPLIIAVVRAEQTTSADEDERPALSGIVPSINTFIPNKQQLFSILFHISFHTF